ncbi:hypothetical protein [Microcoleus vaginatus]|uniref:hypothetical protein n=1 Tax=Microcoleus vaginatus TaxID=119532 RepID=UPI00403F2A90
MKTITKFLINLISVGSIVLIATLNISQFAVVGQPIINTPDRPPNPIPGGPRFIQPTEDIDERPPTQPGRPVRGGCASISQLGSHSLSAYE